MARGLSGERIEKILPHNIFTKKFLKISINLLGIVVSALAFQAGDLGSIHWLGKSSNQLLLLLLLLLLSKSPNLPH